MSVLEIGTGSGFPHRLPGAPGRPGDQRGAARRFRRRRARRGRGRHHQCRGGAGRGGARLRAAARFDAIAVTGAVYAPPERFKRWLKPGGRLFVIEGESPVQSARLYVRSGAQQFAATGLFETDLPYLTHAAPPRSFRSVSATGAAREKSTKGIMR